MHVLYIHTVPMCNDMYYIVAPSSSIVSGVDINECERKEHNCSQLCDNVPGGFVCKCEAGYFLKGDNMTCTGMLFVHTVYMSAIK